MHPSEGNFDAEAPGLRRGLALDGLSLVSAGAFVLVESASAMVVWPQRTWFGKGAADNLGYWLVEPSVPPRWSRIRSYLQSELQRWLVQLRESTERYL